MKTQPLCRYCGGPIRKWTKTVWLRVPKPGDVAPGYIEVEALPQTKAEVQKLTNAKVMSVCRATRFDSATDKAVDIGINRFTTWDGETYVDDFFCSGIHARWFAEVFARAGHCTTSYADAVKKKVKSVA